MRLLIAVTAPRSAGFYAGQLTALRAAGAEVWFLSSPSDEVARAVDAEGATFVPVEMARAPSPRRDARALVEITRALRRIRPDVVNAGTPKAGLLAMLAARALGVPRRVHTLHGLRYESATGPARRALWAAQRLSCAAATEVVCVGSGLRARAVETGLLRADEGTVIGDGTVNGIDVDRFRLDEAARAAGLALRARAGVATGAVVAGYLGRLARDKGVGDLARAWARVGGGARLLIGGGPDETDPLVAAERTALDASGAIQLGHVDDPVAFLAAIDLLVLPTWREGFPTVPLEAAAMGRPVVATDATGCADAVVDGVTGTLVPVRDPSTLARALERYLADPALRRAHGDAGRSRVHDRFTRARVHAATVAFYARRS
jgi:glycosyltransferase involved in cell wall biosynthesis